ncbi:hypothetical protein A3A79_05300 [Candidatus Gottesmanbacteria bacterium RIFCSPLOWO2_01_FULL_43_11b]|uniref:UDP-N-acetylglucosamine--N-acetylmuramyl-(pentapeptide) pyrophosphoryl-undecaprenol N-acetylglucosamine transferase n=1 Tax=Candidatus Gottesmanbacteria bacterium RIFCSPLOWO2_01_FULL_43_11b TaxID=1798392 RepID=A0A1F6AJC6_9BACT|nr:MAG: hypothetical protein A3A79_05300 [Candidatus Gottesmanbacteria bacterium RIFCSPLOWO2_01_FULL_43_11b]
MKILITGGHITPALAVAEEIRERYPDWELVLVGRRFSLEANKIQSEEERLAKKYNLEFIPFKTGRFTRAFALTTLISLSNVPVGFISAINIVSSVRPNLIISFGGYIALPVVIAGKLMGIPTVTHEQTRKRGLSNRIIGLFARKVCVSYPDQKGVYTGLPIRRSIFEKSKPPAGVDSKRPLLFFSGGSTGSQSLNTIFFECITLLTKRYMVVHQTGRASESKQMENYQSFPYIDLPEYAWILQNAKLIIGRSGANTAGEVAALGKVALWIPLPWSGANEQYENAAFLVNKGTSELIQQKNLTQATLISMIEKMVSNYESYKNNAEKYSREISRNAAGKLVDEIVKLPEV